MSDSMRDSLGDQVPVMQSVDVAPAVNETQAVNEVHSVEMPLPRTVGSPLPIGDAGRAQLPNGQSDSRRLAAVPPPERTLTNQAAPSSPAVQPSGFQRAVNTLRIALPFVQRILPLLDGNVGTAVSNILNQRPHPAPPPPPVNLAPIEKGLTEIQTQHRELRDQVVEQNASLKRVEDHLEMVREATDRNTLEQQELLEDLKTVSNKVNVVAVIALGLLGISILLNLLLYLHIQRVLP
ncbi:MAG TPA: hypothetical protein VGT08_19820 [Terracidiphilus sp.]|nr:hypothetical protein [Terracidiphilus sp.]